MTARPWTATLSRETLDTYVIPSALILQIVIAAVCGESPSALEAQRAPDPPRPAISDAAHGGRDGFYFLPTLVPEPEYDGVFDPLRQPVVQICELAGDACPVLAKYTLLSGPDSVTVQVDPVAEHYSVDWSLRPKDASGQNWR